MTPQEAINFINNEVQIDVRFCTDEDIEKTQEAFNLAISTLEKQMPKKPIAIRETLLGKIFSDRIISFTCPNCNHKDLGNNEFRFPCCEECGQTLDWSDYNG